MRPAESPDGQARPIVMAYSDHINEAGDHGTGLPAGMVERGPQDQYQ